MTYLLLIALLVVVAVGTAGAGVAISSSGSAVVTGSTVTLVLLCVFLLFLLLMMFLSSVLELGASKRSAHYASNGAESAVVHLVASVCTSDTARSTTSQSTHQTAVAFSSRLTTVRRLIWVVRSRFKALVRGVTAVAAMCLGGVLVTSSQRLLRLTIALLMGLVSVLLVGLVATLLSVSLVVLRAAIA